MNEEAARRRLKAFVLAVGDMEDVADAVLFLATMPEDEILQRIRQTVETGLFVTYARPFTSSKGLPTLKPPTELSETLRELHEDVLIRRNMAYAHTDESPLRTIVEFDSPDWRERMLAADLYDDRQTPTTAVLSAMRELALMNRQHFINQYLAIERRLTQR